MTSQLFRQEAIDAQRAKLWSDVTLTTPLPLKLAAAALFISVAALGAFLATGSFSHKEHAPGFIAAHEGVANVMAPRGGAVAEVFVKEGQVVKKGDPLFSVGSSRTSLAGNDLAAEEMKSLRRQNTQIRKQIDLETQKADGVSDALQRQVDSIGVEIKTLQAQLAVQSKKTALAKAAIDTIAPLVAKRLITQPEQDRRNLDLLTSQQTELELQRQIAARTTDRDAKADQLSQLPVLTQQRIAELQGAKYDNRLKRDQFEAERGYVVTAPKDGKVSALQTWVGKTVETNVPQMSIVPVNDTLSAELFVPAQAIGLIAPGQPVHLDLASFPYQKFGFVEGTVDTVSYTLLKPDQSVGPIVLATPTYRVSVVLKQQSIKAYGQNVELKADMQLSADIVSDRRSLLDWIVDPLLAALRRSS